MKIGIWGATGSIGKSTLDIVKRFDNWEVVFVSANKRYGELLKIKEEFNVPYIGIADEKIDSEADFKGEDGIREAARVLDYDIMVNAIVGTAGFYPTYEGVLRGKKIALSNKETIVSFGHIILPLAKEKGANIVPVDSEHSALRQLLEGKNMDDIKNIYLTASGGPFWNKDDWNNITVDDALSHPTWSMGNKITIDSATMVNKGLEVIEAVRLFALSPSKVKVVIHPTSHVHAIIEFKDNSFIMQVAYPDMRMPIYYALTNRNDYEVINPIDWNGLRFDFHTDPLKRFKGLKLAYRAINEGGSMPAVFNAANEIAVHYFLNGFIEFLDITDIIEEVMNNHNVVFDKSIDAIWDSDNWARKEAKRLIERKR